MVSVLLAFFTVMFLHQILGKSIKMDIKNPQLKTTCTKDENDKKINYNTLKTT